MTIAQREQQIHRVKQSSFQPGLDEALEQALFNTLVKISRLIAQVTCDKIVKPKSE